MNWRKTSLLSIIILFGFLPIIEFLEDRFEFDYTLHVVILLSIILSSFLGSWLTNTNYNMYFTSFNLLFAILAGLFALYNYMICEGLGCLLTPILLIFIPIVLIINGIIVIIVKNIKSE